MRPCASIVRHNERKATEQPWISPQASAKEAQVIDFRGFSRDHVDVKQESLVLIIPCPLSASTMIKAVLIAMIQGRRMA